MIPKKFKVWDTEKKEMINYFMLTSKGQIKKPTGLGLVNRSLDIQGVTLQYIGLYDDSEREACEADIIQWEAEHFKLEYGWYGDSENKTNEFGYYLANGTYNFKYVGGGEIVGNIFEGVK